MKAKIIIFSIFGRTTHHAWQDRAVGPRSRTTQSNHAVGPRLAGLKRELCSDLSRSHDAL